MTHGPDITLTWISPTLPDDLEAAERQIEAELLDLVAHGLDNMYDLIFHTVFLDNGNTDGPAVTVTVSETGHSFECWYDQTPEWIETRTLDEGPFEGQRVQIIGRALEEDSDDSQTLH